MALQAFLLQKQCLSFTGALELRCFEMYMLSQMETFQTISQATFPGKGAFGMEGLSAARGTPWREEPLENYSILFYSILFYSILFYSSHPMPAGLGLIHFPLILQTDSPALLREPGWIEMGR